MSDNKFGNQIKLWRKARGLSLEEASKIFGISPKTFLDWERGMIPSDRQKERLAKELGLDKDVLFKKCEIGKLNVHLKEKRLEYGLTQAELAKRLGYSSPTICRWEKGVEISEYEAEDICAFFEIEI